MFGFSRNITLLCASKILLYKVKQLLKGKNNKNYLKHYHHE